MSKLKVLIENKYICSLSKIDNDNLKLLKACLPKKYKEDLTENDKLAIEKYNNFIDNIIEKNKNKLIFINFSLNKI